MALTVVNHPLAGTMLTALRDASTPPPLFRLLAKRLSLVLAVEATRTVPTTARPVTTPLAQAQGTAFAAPLVAVPIVRAGPGHAAVGGGRARGPPAPGGRAPVAGRGHRRGRRAPQRPGVHRARAGRLRGPAVRDLIGSDTIPGPEPDERDEEGHVARPRRPRPGEAL